MNFRLTVCQWVTMKFPYEVPFWVDSNVAAKLWIWTLRTKSVEISTRIGSLQKTPNCFKKTIRRFASNAEAFCLKHRNVFFWPWKVNFNKFTPVKGWKEHKSTPFTVTHNYPASCIMVKGVNAVYDIPMENSLLPFILSEQEPHYIIEICPYQ